MGKKVLVMAPHPDDAEFYAGGLIASLVDEGGDVTIVTATDGCCGSYKEAREDLIQIRKKEAQEAAILAGARVVLLGYHDYELDRAPAGELRQKLIRMIREYKPEIIITIDPYASNEAHPDHRALAWAASDAVNHASLPLVHPEQITEGLNPHFVPEKYYYSEDFELHNKIVDITPFMDNKLAAMRAHTSQVHFLVDDFFRQAKMAGVDLTSVLGPVMDDPFQAMDFALITQALQVGRKIGVQYAESFRYTRFHPFIEGIMENLV
jgi:LmbE family N-acetylglucosaminyl deacetylase